jgi:hypothetical protein
MKTNHFSSFYYQINYIHVSIFNWQMKINWKLIWKLATTIARRIISMYSQKERRMEDSYKDQFVSNIVGAVFSYYVWRYNATCNPHDKHCLINLFLSL